VPIVYVNHGDHVFWIGASVANAVMNMRESGRELAVARRGIGANRSLVAPRPLRVAGRTIRRRMAKQRLGVDPDHVLVVTAADAPKYRAIDGPSLLEMILPVFKSNENIRLLAAGPNPTGEWAQASTTTAGRIRALGRLPDVTLLHQAADIYLDSFPFASLTSLLEAGSFSTAVVTYRGHPEECAVLGSDTPGIDQHLLRPSSPESLRRDLCRLIDDRGLRAQLGSSLRRAIAEGHIGDGWRAEIARIYRSAVHTEREGTTREAVRATGALDILVSAIMAETGYRTGTSGAIRDNLGLFPGAQRIGAFARVIKAGTVPSLRHVLPEWVLPWLAPG